MSLPLSRLGLLLYLALSALIVLTVAAPAASAHGANGQPIPDAAHYLTTITALTPTIPGLAATVDPRGEWLEVSNTTSQTLTILGYAREPYLQIDPAGVSENSFSPTLALNQSLFGDLSSQLGGSDSALPPSWRPTSSGHSVRWHDHRIHWMGANRPPEVKSAPGAAHLVGTWSVHMLMASTPVIVTGSLNWLPMKPALSPFMTTFLIIDVAVFAVVIVAVGWFVYRRKTRRGRHVADDRPSVDDQRRPSGQAPSVTASTPRR